MWKHVISAKLFYSDWRGKEEAQSTGKWVVNFPLGDPDDVWDRLVSASVKGQIDATKCSGRLLDERAGHHIACVYCASSEAEYVAKTLTVLRRIGIEGPLRYKTDKATAERRDEYLWTSEQIEAMFKDEPLTEKSDMDNEI